jgi:tetratricopeptide (TPR) repeat protein
MKLKAIGEDSTGMNTTRISHWSDLEVSEELQTLFEAGKPQEVLDKFIQIENQGEWASLPEEEQIASIYYQCCSLEYLGRYEEALQTATRARTTYSSPKNPSFLLALLAAQYRVFQQLGIYRKDESQLVVAEGEAILETLSDEERQTGALWIAVFEQIKGINYFAKKELDLALNSYYRALKSFEALNNRHGIALSLFYIGYTYFFKGGLDPALDYYQRSLTIFEALGNTRWIAECLDGIGIVYLQECELNTALDYFQRELSVAKESKHPFNLYYAFRHQGAIYTVKGDSDRALDYFRQSLAVVEPLGIDWAIAYVFEAIGEAYRQKGALDIAQSFFQNALAKREAKNNDYFVGVNLFNLILLSLEQQDLEQAQKYLTHLQKVTTRIPEEAQGAHLRRRLAEALILKQSPRMTDKAQAQTLLSEIVNEDTFLGSIAMVALCELFLLELKITGEPEVWNQAKAIIHRFYTRAQQRQEFNMVISALLLRAKFALVEGELDRTLEYFKEAKMIAKERDFSLLIEKVESEQKAFELELWKWQDLIQEHTSLKERLIRVQLEEYIQDAQKEVARSSRLQINE